MTWQELTTRYSQEEILRLVKIGLVYDRANRKYRERVKIALKEYREKQKGVAEPPSSLIVLAK